MAFIVASLVANPIQKFILSSTYLDSHVVTILADALRKCPALSTLDLGYDQIGHEGTISLAAALPNCHLLSCLHLNYNISINNTMSSKINSLVRLQPQHKATAALVCWNRRRHTIFGGLVNRVFAAFLLGFIRVVCTDNSVVPDADPEMVEETLESFHRFDLEHTLAQILAAGAAATAEEENLAKGNLVLLPPPPLPRYFNPISPSLLSIPNPTPSAAL